MESKHYLETADYGLMGIAVYRGCLVHKVHTWYETLGKQVKTPAEVDSVIDYACKVIGDSIEKGNSITVKAANGAISAQNDVDGTHVWETN